MQDGKVAEAALNTIEEPPVGELREIEVRKITRNPRNPRRTFDPKTIERLASSLEEIGLQVPITVYRKASGKDEYILLDGERRFRAAKHINWQKIPGLVVQEPSATDNAIRMFNIHMLREEWSEIETAWALEKIMEETGETNDRELQKKTGLSIDRIRNMKRVLTFPQHYQERVAAGEMPYQLLVELDKNLLSKNQKDLDRNGGSFLGKATDEIRDVMLKRYEDNVETDVVDMRKVGNLYDTARLKGKVGERARTALSQLLTQPHTTIEEAFEFGAASSVELSRVLRDAAALPSRFADLLAGQLEPEQKITVRNGLASLIDKLQVELQKLT